MKRDNVLEKIKHDTPSIPQGWTFDLGHKVALKPKSLQWIISAVDLAFLLLCLLGIQNSKCSWVVTESLKQHALPHHRHDREGNDLPGI